MNAEEFLQHHGLVMNPFVAEDAVQDAVLARATSGWKHPDFAKILGEAGHPAPTVVFGERGAGKTALRLQMEQALDAWNERRGDARGSWGLLAMRDPTPTEKVTGRGRSG